MALIRILLVPTLADNDVSALGDLPQCEGATPQQKKLACIEKKLRGTAVVDGKDQGVPRTFLCESTLSCFYLCPAWWCTQKDERVILESRDPALRRCVLAFHVIHVRGLVLALVVEPAAQQAAYLARPGNAAETATTT